MIDREKVIKGLESLRDICNAKSDMAIGEGKVAWAGYANTADDALALLKAQESRLITKDDFEKADAWGTIPAWVEYNPAIEGAEPGWAIVYSDILGSPFKRAWTSRPTEEQRKATPWAEPPKEEPC